MAKLNGRPLARDPAPLPMARFLLLAALFLQTATAWAIKPSKVWIATPDSLGLHYQTLALTTPDHVQLVAWAVEPAANVPDRHTTVVLAYGDMGNMSQWLYQAHAFARNGYRVYLFDYRGFGHSADVALDPQRLYYHEFTVDLATVLADARRRFPHNRTGVLAFSMGTIMGTEVAATGKCDFLISDGYVGNPQRLVAEQWQRRQKVVTLPAEAADYARLARRVHCPWLLVGGTADLNTPVADSVAVVRQARRRQHREVFVYEGGHQEGMYLLTEAEYGDKYLREVNRFLAAERS